MACVKSQPKQLMFTPYCGDNVFMVVIDDEIGFNFLHTINLFGFNWLQFMIYYKFESKYKGYFY